MDFFVRPPDILEWRENRVRCALGRSGVAAKKREGDGATPEGIFLLRQVMYRPDRIEIKKAKLPLMKITPNDAWCDDPKDPSYNRLVRRPFLASHEQLWRQDNIYDVVIELGYNDDPVTVGKGSAIFMHVAKGNFEPTQGCIALKLNNILDLIDNCEGNDRIFVNKH